MLEPYFDRAILCKGSPAAKMFGSFAGQPASEDVQGGVQVAVNKLAALGGTAPSQSCDLDLLLPVLVFHKPHNLAAALSTGVSRCRQSKLVDKLESGEGMHL